MMFPKSALMGAALAAVSLIPGIASASFVLDTGTPTGSGAPYVLSTAGWFAGEFAVMAGQNITGLSAYLTEGNGQPNDTFTFDVYSGSGFTTTRESLLSPVYSATGVFSANGWNTATANWTPTVSGDYWLALQVGSTTDTKGLDLPVESSTATGTVPALAFAYFGSGTNSKYSTAGAPAIGLEVTAAPVPLPAPVLLLGSALLAGLGFMRRRR